MASSSRGNSIIASRFALCAIAVTVLGSYFWQPVGAFEYGVDIALRTYLHFLCGVLAHEASHGHLGRTRRANLWWGRFAFALITELPFSIFRRTHLRHHSHTNIPGEDPDAFLKSDHPWQVPFRALAMTFQWVGWLKRRNGLQRIDLYEYLGALTVRVAVYGSIIALVGWERVLLGLLPVVVLHPMLLWIPFAYHTHEGYSIGAPETRSHNYYGRWLYWASLGLSMHRVHHMRPYLGWLQMRPEVDEGTAWQRLTMQRHILTAPPAE